MNERILALRAHLGLCERVLQLLTQERSHLEGACDGRSGAFSLADRRASLLAEIQTSLEQLRRAEASMAQTDPALQAECSRLTSAAREATLAALERQSEVEALMLHRSLRRPQLDTSSTTPAPATAARLYRHAPTPIPEKPFDSSGT